MKKHICANCQHEFEGNFCPNCGQEATVGRVDWKSVLEELKELGVGATSPLSSIAQLLRRPGHIIREYTCGRRGICSSPISLALLVAIVISLIIKLTGVQIGGGTIPETNTYQVLSKAVIWFMNNLGWGVLLMSIFYILPTWLLFRFAPDFSRHTIPEGIFIQFFMSTLVLIFTAFAEGVSHWLFWLIPVYYYIAYRQLFGYGIWGTLWRTFLVLFDSFLLVVLILWAIMAIVGKGAPGDYPIWLTVVTITAVVVIIAGSLFIGYKIGEARKDL